MDHLRQQTNEDGGSISLQIDHQALQFRDNWGSGSSLTIFEPHREVADPIEKIDSRDENSGHLGRSTIFPAPERKITLFALRLAILEKTASGLGTLGFIWATVVLLGGFAITLDETDFWFITTILLIEGTRIFSRSHELEWQHQTTWSLADAGMYSFRVMKSSSYILIQNIIAIFRPITAIKPRSNRDQKLRETNKKSRPGNPYGRRAPTRTWTTSDVPLLPYAKFIFLSKNISKLLYWLQILSASACVFLALLRLIQQNYGELNKSDTDKRNRKSALNIFYGLALAEAILFLLEKAYWEWKVTFCKLLEEVNKECELGSSGMVSIKRFFYDAYSRCVNGSIFDGLKMDLVSFALELLTSASSDEQLIGAQILQKFSTNPRFSDDTLRNIGICLSVMERLVEMLNWKDPQEEEIRRSAAEIVSKLAGKKRNSLRVAGIPGAMESISSLLYNDRNSILVTDEICPKDVVYNQENYEFTAFNHLGLVILKNLAHNHDNCGKIGNTRGLLSKIIDFTDAGDRLHRTGNLSDSQNLAVKRSLQVVKMLTSTKGTTGKLLRQEVSEIVFTISNIRDILCYGEKYPELQKLGIEILTSLAMDKDAREKIGSTGRIFKELFHIFFTEVSDSQNHVRIAAGEAIGMLELESERNCHRILKLNMEEKLFKALEDPVLRFTSAIIIRNLCAYAGPDCFHHLKSVTAAAPTVLRTIMLEDNKLQEVMLGLAAQIMRFVTSEDSGITFKQAGIKEDELAAKLVQILENNHYPQMSIPRVRRFTIELAIWMMRDNEQNIHLFKNLGMDKEIKRVTETTSELESFDIFSCTVGLSRHRTTIHSLVDTALELLAHG